MVQDMTVFHAIPIDQLTHEAILSYNNQTRSYPKTITNKGDLNSATSIDWDFSKEQYLEYSLCLEGLDKMLECMERAGFSPEILEMWTEYTGNMTMFYKAREVWPAIMAKFKHDRAVFYNERVGVQFNANSPVLADYIRSHESQRLVWSRLEAPRTPNARDFSGGPRRTERESSRGESPYSRSSFPSSRGSSTSTSLCVICNRTGHNGKECKATDQRNGNAIIAKYISDGKRPLLVKISKPDYHFCFSWNTSSCRYGSSCNVKHACTLCGSAEHGACSCTRST